MVLTIGYSEGGSDLILYNIVQSYDLADSRVVEVDTSENGTVWFNLRGKKKPVYKLSFEEIEVADLTSVFKKIQEMSIPDYLIPVWIKLQNANATSNYTIQTEFEGFAYIHLLQKTVAQVPTIREFEIIIYTQ